MKTVIFLLLLLSLVNLSLSSARFERNPKYMGRLQQPFGKEVDGALPKDIPGYMLPDNLSPTHQYLSIQPFISGENLTFSGYTEITFNVVTETNFVTFHQVDLELDLSSITVINVQTNASEVIISHNPDLERDMHTVALQQNLLAGEAYVISIAFVGNINSVNLGFYSGVYEDDLGVEHTYAVTHFQPIRARYAFACFDEPNMKAQFTIDIIRESSMNSASNMPRVSSESVDDQPGWVLDKYATSVKMSSYLVAYQVSDFGFTTVTNGSYQFDVYAPQDQLNKTEYAQYLAPTMLQHFEGYYNVQYALPKLDSISLTEFLAGAMENYGFMTFRDEYLLYNPDFTPDILKDFICQIYSHEIAHQWFGDYVTLDYWEDTWLNEGFATYYEYLGCGAAEPEYDAEGTFVDSELQFILADDDTFDSSPLILSFDNPNQLARAFSQITYAKGGSVLRMMEYFLTEPTLRAGETNYLNNYAFGNAVQDDLFQELTTQALADGTLDPSLTVKQIMDTWTLKMGYPLLTVDRSDNNGIATLTQNRFIENGTADPDGYSWWIPVTYTTQENPNFVDITVTWMAEGEFEGTLENLPDQSVWIICNVKEGGYYRVNYDQQNWDALNSQLAIDPDVIHPINQAQIADDASALCDAGILTCATALKISETMNENTQLLPLKVVLKRHNYLERMFRSHPDYATIQSYLKSFIRPIFDSIELEANPIDKHDDKIKKTLVSSWACELGYEPCISRAKTLYNKWKAAPRDSKLISPDVKYTVYCTAIANGGRTEWEFLFDQLKLAKSPHEKLNLIFALGCTKHKETLKRYLEITFSDSTAIARSHVDDVVEAIAENIHGVDVVWQYLKYNCDSIATYLGSYQKVAEYILTISKNFKSEADVEKIIEFMTDNSDMLDLTSEAILESAVKKVESNIAWLTNTSDEIVQYVKGKDF